MHLGQAGNAAMPEVTVQITARRGGRTAGILPCGRLVKQIYARITKRRSSGRFRGLRAFWLHSPMVSLALGGHFEHIGVKRGR